MPITTEQIREIRQEFARLRPATVTLDGHRPMTIREAIFSLAPTLERMKKRGFDTQEIVERLAEKGIAIKPAPAPAPPPATGVCTAEGHSSEPATVHLQQQFRQAGYAR